MRDLNGNNFRTLSFIRIQKSVRYFYETIKSNEHSNPIDLKLAFFCFQKKLFLKIVVTEFSFMQQLQESTIYPDKNSFRIEFRRNICSVETEEIQEILSQIREIRPDNVVLDMTPVVAIPSMVLNRILKLISELKKDQIQVSEVKLSQGLQLVFSKLKIDLG
nr:STAS domain-containing protein [Leptospira kirschneri]